MKKILLILLLALAMAGCGPEEHQRSHARVYSFAKTNDSGVLEMWYLYQISNGGRYYTYESPSRIDIREARTSGFSGWKSSDRPLSKEELEEKGAEQDVEAENEAEQEIAEAEEVIGSEEAANDPDYDSNEGGSSDVSDSSSSGDSGNFDSGGSSGGGDF